jgi:hypothetical protein
VRKLREDGRRILLYAAALAAVVVVTLTPLVFTLIRLHIQGGDIATALTRIDRVIDSERKDQATIAALVAANRTRIQENGAALRQLTIVAAEAHDLASQLEAQRAAGILSPAATARLADLDRRIAALATRVNASESSPQTAPGTSAPSGSASPSPAPAPGRGPVRPPRPRATPGPRPGPTPHRRCLIPNLVECASATAGRPYGG